MDSCPTRADIKFVVVPEDPREQERRQVSSGRLDEVAADVVAFLCGHDGRWLTGQVIRPTSMLV